MLATATLRSVPPAAEKLACSWTVDPITGAICAGWAAPPALDQQRLGDGLGLAPEPAFVHESTEIDEVRAVA